MFLADTNNNREENNEAVGHARSIAGIVRLLDFQDLSDFGLVVEVSQVRYPSMFPGFGLSQHGYL
jgi:hypothetical protein